MGEKFPNVKFKGPYSQKGVVGMFQASFPGTGFTTFSRFDFNIRSEPLVALFSGDIAQWLFEKSFFDSLAVKYAEKLCSRQAYNGRFEKWDVLCRKIKERSFAIYNTDLSALSLDELFEKFKEFKKIINDFWNLCLFIDMFDAGFDIEETEKINKKFEFSKNEVQQLLTPVKQSYIQRQKMDLYALIENQSEESMEKFLQEYFWLNTDYYNTGSYRKEDLLNELEETKKGNWEAEKAELIKRSTLLKEKQKQLFESKNLEENPFWFFNELTFWRDERKMFNYVGLYAVTHLALEILKRKNIDSKYMYVITSSELQKGIPSIEELRKRISFPKLFFQAFEKEIVFAGADAEKIFSKMEGTADHKGDLRGMSASIGTASGNVKVVLSPTEFGKFKEGEILVTHMTRPEFVPIMKRAAAIVTDEGGITCHAAIISRELGVPCVVGTKIATKVLKDNDFVEVRATHGLVRKLS